MIETGRRFKRRRVDGSSLGPGSGGGPLSGGAIGGYSSGGYSSGAALQAGYRSAAFRLGNLTGGAQCLDCRNTQIRPFEPAWRQLVGGTQAPPALCLGNSPAAHVRFARVYDAAVCETARHLCCFISAPGAFCWRPHS